MTAGYEQCDVRKWRRIVLQQGSQKMALQVMHRDSRDIPGVGKTARQRSAREKGADQAGPCGVGDPTQPLGSGARLLQGALDEGQELPHVVAGGQLRHHAPVYAVELDLAE